MAKKPPKEKKPAEAVEPGKRKGLQNLLFDLRKHWVLWLMVLPVIAYTIIFSYIPMPGIILAFKRFNYRDGIFGSPWAGWDNFKFLIKGGILWRITKNTILYNLVFIIADTVCQIAMAIMLNQIIHKKFKKISQSMMFLPYFISWVLVQSIAYGVFSYEYGLLNNILRSLGMEPINIYATPDSWPPLLTFFHEWKGIGYGTVIYLAAITGIGTDLYEAATLDGAAKWQQIRYITLPLLKPTAITLLLFNVGKILKGQFDLFFQLVGTNGILFEKTDIIDTYVFRTITTNFNPGYSTAAGLYQSLFGFILIMTVNTLLRKFKPEYALF